jgi:hypothetical protein
MLDPLYDDLPDDEVLTFLKLEKSYREACKRNIFEQQRNESNDWFPAEHYLRYMRQVVAAAGELQLGILQDLSIPSADDLTEARFRDFQGQVDYYLTAFQIRQARRNKGYSVRFDDKTKRILNHHLTQMREIITKLEIDEWKRESLLACLNNLQAEVDKNRSRYECVGAFVVEYAGILGVASEKIEPLRKIIDSVAGLLWGAKHAEQTQRLPSPSERKQIPPPKTKKRKETGTFGKRADMDDEIPF